jgi:hypothetical protein
MWHRHSLQLHLRRDVWWREQRARSEDWQVLTSFPAKSRPFENALPLAPSILPRKRCDLVRQVIDPLIEPVPVFGQSLALCGATAHGRHGRMRGNSARKNRRPCRTATPRSKEEGTNLVDFSTAPAHQSLAYLKNSTKDIAGKGKNIFHFCRPNCARSRQKLNLSHCADFLF